MAVLSLTALAAEQVRRERRERDPAGLVNPDRPALQLEAAAVAPDPRVAGPHPLQLTDDPPLRPQEPTRHGVVGARSPRQVGNGK